MEENLPSGQNFGRSPRCLFCLGETARGTTSRQCISRPREGVRVPPKVTDPDHQRKLGCYYTMWVVHSSAILNLWRKRRCRHPDLGKNLTCSSRLLPAFTCQSSRISHIREVQESHYSHGECRRDLTRAYLQSIWGSCHTEIPGLFSMPYDLASDPTTNSCLCIVTWPYCFLRTN